MSQCAQALSHARPEAHAVLRSIRVLWHGPRGQSRGLGPAASVFWLWRAVASAVATQQRGLVATLPPTCLDAGQVYRVGSLLGASYFTASLAWGISAVARRYMLLVVTIGWLLNSWYVAVLAERQQARRPEVYHACELESVDTTNSHGGPAPHTKTDTSHTERPVNC